MSVVEGQRLGPCLLVKPGAPQRAVVQQTLAALMATRGQPAVVQTDRGPCFVGPGGGAGRAMPGRVSMWLWGLGIDHRLIPPGKPQRNGVVERLHGALERNWTGEPDGVAALLPVWNHGKPSTAERLIPYRDRGGFQMQQVWARLEAVRIERTVDRQGKFSLWDRPIRAGRRLRDRDVVIAFDAEREVLVLHDRRDVWLADVALPWFTADWLWEAVTVRPCESA